MSRPPANKLTVKKKRIRRLDAAELERARGGDLVSEYDAQYQRMSLQNASYDPCSLTFGGGRGNHNQRVCR